MAVTGHPDQLFWCSELRRPWTMGRVSVHLGSYNKIPPTGWLINSQNSFLIVLKQRRGDSSPLVLIHGFTFPGSSFSLEADDLPDFPQKVSSSLTYITMPAIHLASSHHTGVLSSPIITRRGSWTQEDTLRERSYSHNFYDSSIVVLQL